MRDILVGKVPDPKSQVEQITTALIYKFMYDMDEEAVEMGGVPSFFVGDYEKYSWKNLFDAKLGGAEKVQLYSDAIENMYTNPTAPPLFREIFKNSFLPFKDPSTLNMFLKEVDEFHYSHSEKLGDAFEYLLSFMGSQGDAGQFRTPRHIIDFIVEIVSPQKNETILDPACGTAGFLISSYKHILSQNTDKRVGDQLTASDRKNIGDNLVGYDISPDMTRISLVNMYLHQFASPQIHEYDSLSSEDRWNEYFDVILANPPFMTPKGGIKPHQRFGVKSNRAEVLFVDYIMEHLKPNGRAGIVVPEGIIFQTGTAYKTLRKKLVEDCLVGVISLPAGVFQPYAGVKTSILILDKELNQKSDSIFFAKVENDGFSLGAQRTEIDKNDLPTIIEILNQDITHPLVIHVGKDEISLSGFMLSRSTYQEVEIKQTDFSVVSLEDVCEIKSGGTPSKKISSYWENGTIPWVGSGVCKDGKIFQSEKFITGEGLDNSSAKIFPKGTTFIALVGATIGKTALSMFETSTNQNIAGLIPKDPTQLDSKFLFYASQNLYEHFMKLGEGGFRMASLGFVKKLKIPLPPIEVQKEIVEEIEGYQKIIDGCRQVVENYKPTIDIDPSWETRKLSEVVLQMHQGLNTAGEKIQFEFEGTPIIQTRNITSGVLHFEKLKYLSNEDYQKYKDKYVPKRGDILLSNIGTIGKSVIVKEENLNRDFLIHWNIFKISVDDNLISPEFLKMVLDHLDGSGYFESLQHGGTVNFISKKVLSEVLIPTPNLEIQMSLVSQQSEIESLVSSNRELIAIYTQKIQDRISKVWGE